MAIFISMAFVFRVLFVNICFFSSLQPEQYKKLQEPLVSGHFKKQSDAEVAAKPGFEKYSAAEICEESPGNEEEVQKFYSPASFSVFFSFFKPLAFLPEPHHSFGSISCRLYPKRYLSLSILRV